MLSILDKDFKDHDTLCETDSLDVAVSILKRKPELATKSSLGRMPLVEAIRHKHADIAKAILMKNRAAAFHMDPRGRSPLGEALRQGLHDVAFSISVKDKVAELNEPHGVSPLHEAIRNNCEGVVQIFLERHPTTAAAVDDEGFTALHVAADYNAVWALRRLREHMNTTESGRLIWPVTSLGHTAVALSASKGHKDAIVFLLEQGDDPARADLDGNTALHMAASSGSAEAVAAIFEYAKPSRLLETRDNYGQTALQVAVGCEVITMLMAKGACIDEEMLRQNTAETREAIKKGLDERQQMLDLLRQARKMGMSEHITPDSGNTNDAADALQLMATDTAATNVMNLSSPAPRGGRTNKLYAATSVVENVCPVPVGGTARSKRRRMQ